MQAETSDVPFISLVIPTRNRPELVEYCLACIARQTFTRFEVILSDNGTNKLCDEQFQPYRTDPRFRYVRPETPLNMCRHWQFAVSFARGDYITVLSEKFMLRPDALSILFNLAQRQPADLYSWQFERYEVSNNDLLNGHYHPLMKPVAVSEYSTREELQRRLDFATPTFYRPLRHKTSYGKLYSGCVKRTVFEQANQHFGNIFQPYSPDYTSMVALLNESETAVDVGQSLMLVVFASGISTGEASKVSLDVTKNYCLEYADDIPDFTQRTLFPGAWVGHNSFIAYDYYVMQQKSRYGPIRDLTINRANLLSWLLTDLAEVSDWAEYDEQGFKVAISGYLAEYSAQQQTEILQRADALSQVAPCPREIYHSGLVKLDTMPWPMPAQLLAQTHWQHGKAPARKNVLAKDGGILAAVDYCYYYNQLSCNLLGITAQSDANG